MSVDYLAMPRISRNTKQRAATTILTKITKNSPTSISGGMNWYFFVVKFLKMMYNIFSSNYMKGII